MDSKDLKGFSEWKPFNDVTVKTAKSEWGVYAIRLAKGKKFGRLRGKSDILYVGCTINKKGIKERLRQYMKPGKNQFTNQRVHNFITRNKTEVSWRESREPENLEYEYLNKYLNVHCELPPLNHATRKRLVKRFAESLSVTDSVNFS